VRRAAEGSSAVVGALHDAGRWLGVALASTFNVLDLQAVVLGGCFGPLAPWLVDEIRATLVERSLAARSGAFTVLPSAFGDGAAVRGAAALPLHRVLDAPWTAAAPPREAFLLRGRSSSGARKARKEVAIGR
jgi:predicted NBD/HSP70 family sugar kinase